MSTTLAHFGEVIDVRPLADTLASSKTTTLIKTANVEMLRMVMRAGKVISDHKAPGDILVQCLERRIKSSTLDEQKQLLPGDLLHLATGEIHAVEAVAGFVLSVDDHFALTERLT